MIEILALCALTAQGSRPGMEAESKAPFSWYLRPADEIGFKDSPQGFQLTYDGALNNGFGELHFTVGSDRTALNNRVRTLYAGYFPVVEYSQDDNGIRYDVRMYAAPAGLDPRNNLVAYVRINISNQSGSSTHAQFSANYGPRGNDSRADLHCRPWFRDKYMDAAKFAKKGSIDIARGLATQAGHLLFGYGGGSEATPTEAGVSYDFKLAKGQSKQVFLKVPFVPIDLNRPFAMKEYRSTSDAGPFSQIVGFWSDVLRGATDIQLDDRKVTDTVKSSLIYDLMARDVEADGRHFTQTVNKFQYHDFYMRDTSFIARSYEMLNLPEVARTTVEHYLVRDKNGLITGFLHNMPDDWGQSLWAVGSYIRTSGDTGFAKEILPAIRPHLDNFEKAVGGDPLGLWPVAGPYDNELVNGHYTSHNLWALLGLREAENICRIAGDSRGTARAARLYRQFFEVFHSRLATLTAKDEGYIPPGMDDPNAGYDWENASGGVYPFGVLAPFDPWVTATLNMERAYKYREGIMTWGPNAWVGKQASDQGKPFDPLYLHDYDTFQVAEALLARGEQKKVVEDLYSSLVHTSSTHAGFETGIKPWGDRDPGDNFPPHGWFAARYNELVRNMLLREDGTVLHLASALAPQWIEPGKFVRVARGATNFGLVDMTIASRSDGATLNLNAKWREAPTELRFHIPWFVQATSAEADGRRVAVRSGEVSIPSGTRELKIRWRWSEHPDLSYDRAVKLWLHKAYEPGPNEDMDHLFPVSEGR